MRNRIEAGSFGAEVVPGECEHGDVVIGGGAFHVGVHVAEDPFHVGFRRRAFGNVETLRNRPYVPKKGAGLRYALR